MKSPLHTILPSLLLAGLLVACTRGALPEAQQDAVSTAVAGTQMATALAQATVNANALTAMPATPTPGPTVEYVTLTEEELAALIDEAVAEAVSATEQTTTAVTTTTSDGTVTYDEVEYMYPYYYYADYCVAYTEELLNAYYDLYGDLAYEMIFALQSIESELTQLNYTLSLVATSLDEMSSTLSQGLELAEDSIAKLQSAAQQTQEHVTALQTQAQTIMSTLETDQQNRLDAIAQLQADNVPNDRISALQTGFQFIDFANNAMADDKLSRDELLGLAQLGVNAQAGFRNFGGAGGPGGNAIDLNQFSGRFNEISTQFARGQMPQARGNLQQFEVSLGERPSRPGGGGLPGGGNGPDLLGPRN
jgi:gas vesicle protein